MPQAIHIEYEPSEPYEARDDQFKFWNDALYGKPVVNDSDTACYAGFYKLKIGNDQIGAPVALWYDDDGNLQCRIGGKPMSAETAKQRWMHYWNRPVPREVYMFAKANGRWPNTSDAVALDNVRQEMQQKAAAAAHTSDGTERPNAAVMGVENTFDNYKERIDDLVGEARRLIAKGAAKNKNDMDAAAALAVRIAELNKQVKALKTADPEITAEMRATVERVKQLEARWKPLIDTTEIHKDIKAKVVTPYLTAEQARIDRENEERRRAEEAERKKHEEAAKAAVATGQEPPPPPEKAPEPQRPKTAKAGDGTGRSVHLTTVKTARIDDFEKVLMFFKAHPDVQDLIQRLCNAAVRAKVPTIPDGVTVIETKEAR